jgi:hypothetical protein
MMKLAKSSFALFGLLIGVLPALAVERGDRLDPKEQTLTPMLRETAMPDMADLGGGRLAKILTRYYEDALGGPENWASISSLKLSGSLKLEDSELSLTALQKKPNLVKMTLRRNQRDLVLAYNGTEAWQRAAGRDAEAVLMEDEEARRFIHSAQFGNYLLHPYAEGKEIVYMDTVPVEGNICHQIRVTLETGFQLDYFIDIRTYMEIKVASTDLLNGLTHSIIYSDHIRENGMPIARTSESYENGEWVSTLTLTEATVNAGVIPWMFDRPQ